jgi:hypothetical protein
VILRIRGYTVSMTQTPDAISTTFVLQDNITGRYLPGRYTWDEAKAQADDFTTIRRLDEALAEREAGR